MIAIARRELVAVLRSPRALVVQLAFLIVPGLLVLLRWPNDAHADVGGNAAGQVIRVFGYGLMAGLMLVSPAFPATSIVRERIQGTLALLLNAPIQGGVGGMLLGKLAGSLGLVFLLLMLSLPGAAACYAMGGVDLGRQLGRLYLVLGALAVEYTSLALFVSSRARGTDGALRVTYGLILGLAIAALAPARLIAGVSWTTPLLESAASWLSSLSPIPAIVEILGDTGAATGSPASASPSAATHFLWLSPSLSVCLLLLALRQLASRPLDRARSAGRITDEQSRRVQAWRRVMYLWFFDPQRRSAPIAAWQNPVMVKEQRCRRFGRGGWLMRLIGAYLVLSLLLVFGAIVLSKSEGVAAVIGIIALMQVCLILLLAPSLASGLVSGERESRGWQLLQTTPMTTLTIVLGKLLSAAVPLALVFVATLPAFVVLVGFDSSLTHSAFAVGVTVGLLAAASILLAAAIGSFFRNTAAATATSYAILVALCGGTLMFWLGQDAPFGRRFVESVLVTNPVAATFSIVGMPGFAQYHLVPGTWYFMAALAALALVALLLQVNRLSRPR